MSFPIFKTKVGGVEQKFDLTGPEGRKEYFMAKASCEIELLRKHLKENTFIAYFMGKKNSGKGTYAKMFTEIVGGENIIHLSVGDIIRGMDQKLGDEKEKKELVRFLGKNYRGFQSLEEIMMLLESRSTKKLLPTELILTLVKEEINKSGKKTIFIDGFPRDMDQISYSLFFRDLVGYRSDDDVFVLIDVPMSVIDERIKYRRICPKCQTSRNLKLLVTSKVEFDMQKGDYHLLCDNPECQGAVMVQKEGDEFGIEPIIDRLKLDDKLIKQAFGLYGIPKVLLRNSIPVEVAGDYVDDYEITPEYVFDYNEQENLVNVTERPYVAADDNGVESYSLLPPPVVLAMIKQLVEIFDLS
ncbi:nucleoside monophosphate kinase [Patescibacteria group bacterium]|nr:nucleoside monophosphate kinase [Patescibacteria group bacterium]